VFTALRRESHLEAQIVITLRRRLGIHHQGEGSIGVSHTKSQQREGTRLKSLILEAVRAEFVPHNQKNLLLVQRLNIPHEADLETLWLLCSRL
jgi:hypothetical protein